MKVPLQALCFCAQAFQKTADGQDEVYRRVDTKVISTRRIITIVHND